MFGGRKVIGALCLPALGYDGASLLRMISNLQLGRACPP